MNLTAVKEENEVMERHVEDSLAIIEPVRDSYMLRCGDSFENLSVVDVGSGAGLPGVILAIACPSTDHDHDSYLGSGILSCSIFFHSHG